MEARSPEFRRPVLKDSPLIRAQGRLGIRSPGEEGDGPVWAEFIEGRTGWRLRHAGRGQSIARAVGLKKGKPPPRVVDATAGLGRDAALLAVLGCQVVAVERSPDVHAVLKDGLHRALVDPELGPALGGIELLLGDAALLIPEMDPAPQVVLVDPMHPDRVNRAKVRKEMRVLREVVGEDADAGELAEVARAWARDRVVIKRPAKAPPLLGDPSFQVAGKTVRFDVYLRVG